MSGENQNNNYFGEPDDSDAYPDFRVSKYLSNNYKTIEVSKQYKFVFVHVKPVI